MIRSALSLVLVLTAALTCARADVLHLRNGRTLEGQVVAHTKRQIRLRVPGGVLSIPAKQVERVERRRPASDDYAARSSNVDFADPKQIVALADWASARGLGERARQLRTLARGVELEQRVARAKQGRKASAYYDTYAWAKAHGFSTDVQRYLLDELLERWPRHEGAKAALYVLDAPAREAARREQEAREAEEKAKAAREAEALALRKRVEELEAREKARKEEDQRLRRRRGRRARDSRLRNQRAYVRPLFTLDPETVERLERAVIR